jgi:hypothetical protein
MLGRSHGLVSVEKRVYILEVYIIIIVTASSCNNDFASQEAIVRPIRFDVHQNICFSINYPLGQIFSDQTNPNFFYA